MSGLPSGGGLCQAKHGRAQEAASAYHRFAIDGACPMATVCHLSGWCAHSVRRARLVHFVHSARMRTGTRWTECQTSILIDGWDGQHIAAQDLIDPLRGPSTREVFRLHTSGKKDQHPPTGHWV